MFCHYI